MEIKKNNPRNSLSPEANLQYDLQVQRNFRRVCRLCGNSKAAEPLFVQDKTENILTDIKAILGLELCADEGLPNRVCYKCLVLMEAFKKFTKTALHKDHQFKMMQVRQKACGMQSDDEEEDELAPLIRRAVASLKCFKCGKEFISKARCKMHIEICLKAEDPPLSHLCDICGKEFKKLIVYRRHRAQHIKHFPFTCDQCPYRGQFKDLLRVHMRSHMEVKPFKCSTCSKTFATSSNLTKHTRTHLTERTIQCDMCEKTFKQKDDLKRHKDAMHGLKPKIRCEFCGNTYTKNCSLYKHLKKVHNIIKTGRHGRLPSYLMAQQPTEKLEPPSDCRVEEVVDEEEPEPQYQMVIYKNQQLTGENQF